MRIQVHPVCQQVDAIEYPRQIADRVYTICTLKVRIVSVIVGVSKVYVKGKRIFQIFTSMWPGIQYDVPVSYAEVS